MNKQVRLIGILTTLAALACASIAYFLAAGFWQSLLINIGTTFFGLGLAVLAINYFLASSDKKLAAKPLLKLIAPNVGRLHNELFIEHLHRKLGKDQFEKLLDIYQRHKRDPRAFSPEQRTTMYSAIQEIKSDLLSIYEIIQEQFRELTLLLGWSFDSKITGASLDARINFATFKAATWDGSDESKTAIIEAYLDAEATTSAVYQALTRHLGLKKDEWQESN